MADSYRTASPHSSVANRLRPKPHRWTSRLDTPLCQQAMDLGFDGLIVESHCSPDDAWSDAKQQVTPDVLDYILSLLVVRDEHYSTEGLLSCVDRSTNWTIS